MIQCTAVTLLPAPAYITELATPERPAHAGHVACELGEHDGDHAQLLWTEDERDGAVWARWSTASACIEFRPWCGALTDNPDEACGLFKSHPAGHSWQVTDPTREALRAVLAHQYPHVYPRGECPPERP
ncbi:hypothetical protein ACWGLO_03155 [Streptomyces niveus]